MGADARTDRILREAGEYLNGLGAFTFQAEVLYDIVTTSGQKLSFGGVTVQEGTQHGKWFYVGHHRVEGIPCHHLAFSQETSDYLAPNSRWRPFMSLDAGSLVTANKVPEATSRFNLTPQAGLGLAFARNERTLFTFEYRFHHSSNADTAEPNPGINSSSFHLSVSIIK